MPRVNRSGEAGEGIQAVVLTLRILEALAEQTSPVGITELGRMLGSTKSRISRHVQTLMAQGYVARDDETERYRSGPRLITLGHRIQEGMDIVRVARPHIRKLRDELGSVTTLAQLEDAGLLVINRLPGLSKFEQIVGPGSLMEYDRSAQGAVALAFAEERVLAGLARARVPFASNLSKTEAARIRERGWALAINRWLVGINALAAPVFNGRGQLAATIGIVETADILPDPPKAEQIAAILNAAHHISQGLGFSGQFPGLATAA